MQANQQVSQEARVLRDALARYAASACGSDRVIAEQLAVQVADDFIGIQQAEKDARAERHFTSLEDRQAQIESAQREAWAEYYTEHVFGERPEVYPVPSPCPSREAWASAWADGQQESDMSAAQQAKARRRQARNGFRHLAKLGRPIYKRKSLTSQAKRLAEQIAKERAIQQRKGMGKR